MATLAQSTAYTRMFLMVDSADHVTGKAGLTVTVTLSKAGAAFGAAGGSVSEVSSGWYKIALTTTDTGTLGDLAFHCTATGADPTDFVDQVTDWTPAADALLKRDMSSVSSEAARSPLNALRFLRNKWSISSTTLTVTKEDDTTSAWTSSLTTDAAANPVTASDPS